MSLVVWLPLTKDLRQQGLSNVTVTNSGATYESSGKLGGCYNLTNGPINITNLPNPTSISVAFWFKRTANTNTRQFMFTAWSGVTCELTTDGKPTFAVYRDSYPTITGPTAITTSTGWIHYCGTFSPTEGMKMYLNGELVASNTNTTAISWSTTTGQIGKYGSYASMSAQMDDFRIYDHALSQIEVKELAKGLVLHYPLNRNGWGQENLARNTGVRAPDSTSQVEFRAFKVGNLPIVAGETITVSFDLKMEIGTAITNGTPYLYVYNTNYRGPHGKWIAFTNKVATPFIPIGNYAVGDIFEKRVFFTTTVASSFDPGTSTEDWIEFYSNYDTENKITINNLKIERGTIATPWCPHIEDTNNMGLNSTTEYDCSGFCNNGTRIGTFNWTSNTAKYAVSTKFNGTDNAIQTPSLPTMITDKNYTIAVWIYKTVIGSKGYQTIYGGPSGFEIEARNGSANETKFVPWNWGKPMASYELNEWNHCVFVHSDADCKIYLNGEYIATGTAKASNPTGNYFVGAWNTATQQNFDGLMSDFRIYATALSADDVKSLYQNCATIDPDGTIRGQIRS